MLSTLARRIWGALVRGLNLIVGMVRGLFRRTSATAEMLSDAGHGPEPWREDSDFENPYAGSGPKANEYPGR